MKKKFWFFDLDGTLADTDGDIRLAWKAALNEMCVDTDPFDRLFVAGPTIEDMAKKMYPELYSDEFVAQLRKKFGEHYDGDGFPTTKEYPRIIDCVRRLKASGAEVYIVTNKRFAGASIMSRHFGWDKLFDGLYTADMYASDPKIGKLRKPELLKLVMDKLGALPDECVMVGDTSNDFNAASQNGVDSIGVSWGYGTEEELKLASRIVNLPEEIV
jgi:phosphoglycolate phosphatase